MSKVAAIQMASGPNVQANLDEARKFIGIAVQQGAELIVLPENFAIMGMTEMDKVAVAEKYGQGLIQNFLSTGLRPWYLAGGRHHTYSIH